MEDNKSQSDLIIWRLASIRLDPDSEAPELFCLILEGEKDRPLMHEERIIFFNDLKNAEMIIKEYGNNIFYDDIDLDEPFFDCDIASLLYILSSEDNDEDRVIVDSINLLLDLVTHTGIPIGKTNKQILYKLADYFTFEKDISLFYKNEKYKKDEIIGAILWCIGAIVVKSTLL